MGERYTTLNDRILEGALALTAIVEIGIVLNQISRYGLKLTLVAAPLAAIAWVVSIGAAMWEASRRQDATHARSGRLSPVTGERDPRPAGSRQACHSPAGPSLPSRRPGA